MAIIAGVPTCDATAWSSPQELPYDEVRMMGFIRAEPTFEIPDWCPLDDEEVVDDGNQRNEAQPELAE